MKSFVQIIFSLSVSFKDGVKKVSKKHQVSTFFVELLFLSRLIFFDFSGKMRVALKLSAFSQWAKVWKKCNVGKAHCLPQRLFEGA